ncbi:hypothetical protein [Aeromonas veronii]|uniref:Uncharacterized protein n=1 Tax=Aeromonas veronii TaxID=654 RepID=A0A4S5CKV4_AERVE|nr:hypothetical protein [Aeromonas veronii]THJ45015.1 hypothetical protein E8Q35_12565 [Aeromonas veronii]
MSNIEISAGESVLLSTKGEQNPNRFFIEFKWEPAPRRRSLIERIFFIKSANQDLPIDCDFEVSTEARDVNHNRIGETSFKRNGAAIKGVKHFTGKRWQEFVSIDFDKLSSDTECLLFSLFDERPKIFWCDGHFTCTITNGDKVELLKYKYRFSGGTPPVFPNPCIARIQLVDNHWAFTALADI